MPTPQPDLLYETLDACIAAEPQGRFHQSSWVEPFYVLGECLTAGCYAGHRAFLDGYTELKATHALVNGLPGPNLLVNPETGDELITWSSAPRSIQEYAQIRLGLTFSQATRLFYAGNSLGDLKEIVDRIVSGELR